MATLAGTATQHRAPRWWVNITGIAAVLLGVSLLTQTAATLMVVVTFVGAYWLVSGIATLLNVFADRSDWGWKLLAGAIGMLTVAAAFGHR